MKPKVHYEKEINICQFGGIITISWGLKPECVCWHGFDCCFDYPERKMYPGASRLWEYTGTVNKSQ